MLAAAKAPGMIILGVIALIAGLLLALVYNITEPILGPVRDMVDRSPLGGGYGLDFSPIFALILMKLVQTLLISGVQMIF